MSNKLKLTSIAILIIVIVTGSLLTFSLFNSKSNKEDKLAQVNSISSVSNYVLSSSSVSSSTVSSFTNSSSSSSTQNQSSIQNTTSIIGVSSNANSVVKQEKLNSEITKESKKSVKDSCNPVKVGDTNYANNNSFYYEPKNKCIGISYSGYQYGSVFKDLGYFKDKEYNDKRIFLTEFNINLIHSIANDYVDKVNPQLVSKEFKVYIDTKGKVDNNFAYDIYVDDPDYIKINPNAELDPIYNITPRLKYQYFIFQDSNNNWNWRFNKVIKE